ncbi:hypothetical protein CHU98_g1720 [Xylaria longipes]|nr:hypothetical protein CHU98_g1720 [Xylaria longipes]
MGWCLYATVHALGCGSVATGTRGKVDWLPGYLAEQRVERNFGPGNLQQPRPSSNTISTTLINQREGMESDNPPQCRNRQDQSASAVSIAGYGQFACRPAAVLWGRVHGMPNAKIGSRGLHSKSRDQAQDPPTPTALPNRRACDCTAPEHGALTFEMCMQTKSLLQIENLRVKWLGYPIANLLLPKLSLFKSPSWFQSAIYRATIRTKQQSPLSTPTLYLPT